MKPIRNRLIVRFHDIKAIEEFRELNADVEVKRLYAFEEVNFAKQSRTPTEEKLYNTVVITSSGQEEFSQDYYEKFRQNPAVDYVQYDQEYELFAKLPSQRISDWWFTAINYKKARMAYQPAHSIRVAVIDSGIDHNHPDLDPASFENANNRRDFTNLTWVNDMLTNPNGDAIPLDQAGFNNTHGTHVAGIIAALYNQTHTVGIANRAPLMNLRAYPNGTESTLCVAIRYAVLRNAKVINASWGTLIDLANPEVGSALQDAVDDACSRGTVMICAAGDNQADVSNYVPACFDNVVAVGSVAKPNSTGVYKKAITSNDGAKVISAPGARISSLNAGDNNHMLIESGTSMSAAFVTGLVARMLDQEPNLARPTLVGTCNIAANILQYIHTRPVENSIGRGMIDVEATLKNLPHIP